MARRMFSGKIIESDKFFDMSFKAQILYFYLNMNGDDDGFITNPKRIMRLTGLDKKFMGELVKNGFILVFESGVAVVAHWHIHNLIRKDRYVPTVCSKEFSMLSTDENGVYFLTEGEPNDNQRTPEDRLGEDRSGEFRSGEGNIKKDDPNEASPQQKGDDTPTPEKESYGFFKNVMLTSDELEGLKLTYPNWQQLIGRLSEYMASSGKEYNSHYATLRHWAARDESENKKETKPPKQGSFDADEFFELATKRTDVPWLKNWNPQDS